MTRHPRGELDSPTAKIMAVLETVAQLGNCPVSTVAERTGLPVPTAHRICTELERVGHLQRVPGSRNWTVARPLVDLSANAIASAAATLGVHAILAGLTQDIGEMTSLAVMVGNELVYVASAEAPHELTLSFRAGRKAPLFCTSSGRIFLSRLSDEAIDDYLKWTPRPNFTKHTISNVKDLRARIALARRRGYATANQEYILHVVGAAVPVEVPGLPLLGVLSVAAPDARLSMTQLDRLVPSLLKAAKVMAESLRRHLE
jgi:DNA-binding IclR family transcriptional regulator